ncbi:hypothetical protein ABIA39_002272 [Nocardia sp. GAS34]|uniref:hypothetical protein n=1 Tax=unclassified Nocardia TaxID=2637762 RepID=UPI003D254F62
MQRSEALRVLASCMMTIEMTSGDDPDYREAMRHKLEAGANAIRCGVGEATVQRMGRFTMLEMQRIRQLADAPVE